MMAISRNMTQKGLVLYRWLYIYHTVYVYCWFLFAVSVSALVALSFHDVFVIGCAVGLELSGRSSVFAFRAPGEEEGASAGVEDSQEVCTTSFSTSPPSQVSSSQPGLRQSRPQKPPPLIPNPPPLLCFPLGSDVPLVYQSCYPFGLWIFLLLCNGTTEVLNPAVWLSWSQTHSVDILWSVFCIVFLPQLWCFGIQP